LSTKEKGLALGDPQVFFVGGTGYTKMRGGGESGKKGGFLVGIIHQNQKNPPESECVGKKITTGKVGKKGPGVLWECKNKKKKREPKTQRGGGEKKQKPNFHWAHQSHTFGGTKTSWQKKNQPKLGGNQTNQKGGPN